MTAQSTFHARRVIAAGLVAVIVAAIFGVLQSDTPGHSATPQSAPVTASVALDAGWLTGVYLLDMQSPWYTGAYLIRYTSDCPQCDVYTVGVRGPISWPVLVLHWNGTAWESTLAGRCTCGITLTATEVVGGIVQTLSFEHHSCDGMTDATGTLTRISD